MINERDIFYFVFNKELLDPNKIKSIESTQIYNNEIQYFWEIKKSIKDELSDREKNNISSYIADYKPDKIIELFPIESSKANNSRIKFAASSKSILSKKFSSKTFYDNSKQLLVRANFTNNITKIYIFSASGEKLKDVKVILYPSENEYELQSSDDTIVIQDRVEISSIKIVV